MALLILPRTYALFEMRWKRSQDPVISLIFVPYEKDVIFYLWYHCIYFLGKKISTYIDVAWRNFETFFVCCSNIFLAQGLANFRYTWLRLKLSQFLREARNSVKLLRKFFDHAIFRKFSRLLDVFHAFRCGKFIAFSQIPREMKKIGKSTSLALIAIVEGSKAK